MGKLKKILLKFKTFIIGFTMIAILIALIVLNSSNYYSVKLTDAIYEENISEIKEIIKRKPSSVNTLPTFVPLKIRYYIMDLDRVLYPLNTAIATGNMEVVKILVESGADVNGNDGFTPLSVVYRLKPLNWYKMSLYLIEHGATLNYITDYSGDNISVLLDIVQVRAGSALPDYIKDSDEEVEKAFYYAIDNCNRNEVDWFEVMQSCIANDRVSLAKFLLDKSYVDVNDKDKYGGNMTFLMFASRDSNLEMVELLLERGADTSVVNEDGKIAYDYAVEYKNEEVIPILKKYSTVTYCKKNCKN